MGKPETIRRLWPLGPLAAGLLLVACGGEQSTFGPAGPRAERIDSLAWLLTGLGAVVFLLVLAALGFAVVRGRRNDPVVAEDDRSGLRLVIIGGVILPLLVLPIVFFETLRSMSALGDPEDEEPLRIQVIGHQWWWEVIYPGEGFRTANQINIPAGQPVEIEMTSADVIHSFWVPKLHGKVDMMPGHVTRLWIEADEPGTFRGQCAEFCGLQHAKMAFHVVALPESEFEQWQASQAQPPVRPQTEAAAAGEGLYLSKGCAECHAIRGTDPQHRIGPDLTHLMSREWIGAGTLPNNRGSLALWLVGNQEVKPGNLMPEFELEPDELAALLAYLTSLE